MPDYFDELKQELQDVVERLAAYGVSFRGVLYAIGEAIQAVEKMENGPAQGAEKKRIVLALIDWMDDTLHLKQYLAGLLHLPAFVLDWVMGILVDVIVQVFNLWLWKTKTPAS